MKPTSGRRSDDNAAQRKATALLVLCIMLSLLASYTSYRALRTMDTIDQLGHDLFNLGRASGKSKTFSDLLERQ